MINIKHVGIFMFIICFGVINYTLASESITSIFKTYYEEPKQKVSSHFNVENPDARERSSLWKLGVLSNTLNFRETTANFIRKRVNSFFPWQIPSIYSTRQNISQQFYSFFPGATILNGALPSIVTYFSSTTYHTRQNISQQFYSSYLGAMILGRALPYIAACFSNTAYRTKQNISQQFYSSYLGATILGGALPSIATYFSNTTYDDVVDGEKTKKIMDGIPHRLKEVRDILKKKHPEQNVTVLLGNTMSGKTTIYNYLQDIPLEAKKCEKTGRIIIDKKKPDGDITHGMVSGTALPSVSKDGKYIDCPGFLDNRTIGEQTLIQQDIINGYSLYRLFLNEEVKKIRLVLVVSSGEILDIRGSSFLGVIQQVDELFPTRPNNVDIAKGLSLIVTKGTPETGNQIRPVIKQMLEENPSLTNLQKEVLKHFEKKDSPIEFFHAPTALGNVPTKKPLLKSQHYMERKKYVPSIPMSTQSKLNMVEVSNIVENDISNCLLTFHLNLPKSTIALIANNNKKASELRIFFGEMASKIEVASKISSTQSTPKISKNNEFKKNIQEIKEVLKYFDPELQEKFSELMICNKIFRKIVPHNLPIQLDLDSHGVLTKSLTYLEPLSKKPVPFSNDNSLHLEGSIIGTSDLQGLLNKEKYIHKKDIHNLTAYGFNTILIDEDVDAPGVSVSLISPFWNVIGSRTINLQGGNNDIRMPKASKGKDGKPNGEDGKPGEPGGSGGSFYGVVDKLNHDNFLTINVSGGTGGKGQDGGDGKDGNDGSDGKLSRLKEKDQETLKENTPLEYSWPWNILTYPFVANDDTREVYKDGTNGENGGNAGAGGAGGLGGLPGFVTFANTKFEDFTPNIAKIWREEGERGDNGNHGEVGRGGRNGKRYEGTNTNSSINKSECATKSTVEGAIGGVVGGGIGIATGVITTAAVATAWPIVVGVAVGAMIPPVGSKIHQWLWSGWNDDPHLLQYEEYAFPGKEAEDHNSNNLIKPKESHIINKEEIRNNWNNLNKKNGLSNGTIE